MMKAALFALLLTASNVAVQAVGTLPTEDTLKWALQAGGPSFVLTLVVFWFYRKDVVRLLDEQKTDRAQLIDVVRENTAAKVGHSAQIERLSRAVEGWE